MTRASTTFFLQQELLSYDSATDQQKNTVTTPQDAKAVPLLFTPQVWLATWFNPARMSRELFDQ